VGAINSCRRLGIKNYAKGCGGRGGMGGNKGLEPARRGQRLGSTVGRDAQGQEKPRTINDIFYFLNCKIQMKH